MTRLTHTTLKTVLVLSTGLAALSLTPIFAAPAQLDSVTADAPLTMEQFALSPAQVRADVDLARSAYADIHPGYTRFATDAELDAAWDSITARADRQGGMTEEAFYLALSETLALIRCDHTKAELSEEMKEARKTDPVYIPLSWQVVDGRALVISDADGVKAGDEIVSVDGRSLSDMISALERYVPYDGYNTHIRAGEMASSGEFIGGAVDHFGSMLWDVPATASIEIERPDGTRATVELDRVGYTDWLALQAEPRRRNFVDSVHLERVGERGAVLSVDTFVNYRQPVDPYTVYGPVFEALAAEGRDQLVLDLRRNGGGSNDAANALYAYFIDTPQRLTTEELFATIDHTAYEDRIRTWNPDAVNPPASVFTLREDGYYVLQPGLTDTTQLIEPAEHGFHGELTVLTSRSNSSGSAVLIAALQHARDVTLVGERTGGNPDGPTAGTIFFMTLPESGVTIRVPVVRSVINSGDVEDGVGLVPDVFAPDTVESVRAGTDPAMEAALARIER